VVIGTLLLYVGFHPYPEEEKKNLFWQVKKRLRAVTILSSSRNR
jgi:hypothetical protein